MHKKVLSLILVISMIVTTIAGCGGKGETKTTAGTTKGKAGYASDAKIKLWGSQEDQEMLKNMIANFKEDHPEAKNWTIDMSVISASDAKTEVLKDPSVAADVFEFASDQIAELQAAGALYRITKNKDQVIKNSVENSIESATINGELYGYPSTANSFFMYYDKSKFTEEEVKSLDSILAKDLENGVTNFSMDIDNGWYLSSFFFGAGCTLFGKDGMDPTQCDFNNDKGVLVGDYILDLAANPKVKNHDGALLLAAFKDGKLGATFSGTWDAKAIKESLGDNFGVTTVPTITLEDGTVVSPSTIANFNLYGVNAQTKYAAESMLLAEYLSNEKCQKMRFEVRNSSPTNVNLLKNKELLNTSPAVAVLSEQVKTSTNQPSISQITNFWQPMEAFGQDCIAKAVTKENMKEKLDSMVKSVLSKLGEQ
ncbi:extracellular solute-binding protein [Anaerosacchariphilus polymeriproducens]|uniref:Extracellular solute-binding protein n=1 Tax=Anaerosacchariphilus polymeriproducens TaxID=1812858 RepID=A0A371ASE2_9FIRM|nr:extracellular solute-binding protein [Anaerosacchariphilus polymeriproducens]RDU22390.1 extracellular solute-binding protein [Anaerosacchariphilus polymeriproducens]